ncbi:TPA: GTP cyclohydrolase, FolE2/MptA family, partial [Serratia marcescens]
MNEVALPPRRSLPDAQAWRGEMSDVGLDWVGMQGIALPLELAGKPLMAKVDAGINLRAEAAGERGIHMSRLYLALDELTQGELTPQRLGRTLQAFLDS